MWIIWCFKGREGSGKNYFVKGREGKGQEKYFKGREGSEKYQKVGSLAYIYPPIDYHMIGSPLPYHLLWYSIHCYCYDI